MRCSKCDFDGPPTAKFCVKCGEKLSSDTPEGRRNEEKRRRAREQAATIAGVGAPASVAESVPEPEMELRFWCSQCNAELTVPQEHAGKVGKCKSCGASVQAPTTSQAPPGVSLDAGPSAVAESDGRPSPSGLSLAAGMVSCSWALFVILMMASAFADTGLPLGRFLDLTTTGWFNLCICAAYAAAGVGILLRSRWGYTAGLGINCTNLCLSVLDLLRGQARLSEPFTVAKFLVVLSLITMLGLLSRGMLVRARQRSTLA